MQNTNIVKEFKVVLLDKNQKNSGPDLTMVNHGIITDFAPKKYQKEILKEAFYNPDEVTLFSVDERNNASFEKLVTKQVLNYIETYALGMPGLFNLEVSNGKIVPIRFVKGVNKDDLTQLVHNKLYSNAPFNVDRLYEIIKTYDIGVDNAQIQNNEIKVKLFDPTNDKFDNGDDAVRYICYAATNDSDSDSDSDTLLIKSKEVLEQIQNNNKKIPVEFFETHAYMLSQVYNRHKNIILSAKNNSNKTAINKIARLSKKNHVPIKEAINKKFVSLALNDPQFDCDKVLKKIGVRDKFKFLNTLEFKKNKFDFESYTVRNGKIFNKGNAKKYNITDVDRVEQAVLKSLSDDLNHLKDKVIVLDKNVDYGLPTSQKQCVGNLPYGTEIEFDCKKIAAGIYWRNEWGASDLDLSAVDNTGNRIGWGQSSGYGDTKIVYSGDMTDAHRGAMEFMTSENGAYGLFVNIFSGKTGCKAQVVVGEHNKSKNKWLENAIIVEDITLNSRGGVVGFVNDKKFIVFSGRISNKNSNFGERNAIIEKNVMNNWTIKKLFDSLNIQYTDSSTSPAVATDYDLSYSGITYNKFEEVFF